MKIYSNRASSFISSLKLSSVLVYGNDPGEITEIECKIIKQFLPEAGDMSVIDLPADKIKEDQALLWNEISSMNFFAEKKLIRIVEAPDSLAKLLEKIIPALPPEIFLLVSSDELAKTSALRKLYEDSPNLAAILCYKEDEAGIRNYISSQLRESGIQAEPDALDYLATNLGENKMVTNNEIEKIKVFLGQQKTLSFEEALSLLAGNGEITLMNLAFAVTSRDARKLEKNLANMFDQQQNAVAILRTVIWHFQRLVLARAEMDEGMRADQVVKNLRPPVFFKQVPEFNKALSLWSKEKLNKALEKLLKAELDVKKSVIEPELICHRALLSLAA